MLIVLRASVSYSGRFILYELKKYYNSKNTEIFELLGHLKFISNVISPTRTLLLLNNKNMTTELRFINDTVHDRDKFCIAFYALFKVRICYQGLHHVNAFHNAWEMLPRRHR